MADGIHASMMLCKTAFGIDARSLWQLLYHFESGQGRQQRPTVPVLSAKLGSGRNALIGGGCTHRMH